MEGQEMQQAIQQKVVMDAIHECRKLTLDKRHSTPDLSQTEINAFSNCLKKFLMAPEALQQVASQMQGGAMM